MTPREWFIICVATIGHSASRLLASQTSSQVLWSASASREMRKPFGRTRCTGALEASAIQLAIDISRSARYSALTPGGA
jgi:hypothetical protein